MSAEKTLGGKVILHVLSGHRDPTLSDGGLAALTRCSLWGVPRRDPRHPKLRPPWRGTVGELNGCAAARSSAVAAALECAALIFAHATPDAGILAALNGPCQALGGYWATVADDLRTSDLCKCRAGASDGEKQFGVFVAADCFVAPVHGVSSFSKCVECVWLVYLSPGQCALW